MNGSTRFRLPYLLPLSCALLVAACGPQQQQSPAGAGATPEVTVVELKTEPVVLTRELPGRAHAHVIAEIRPQVAGIIRERSFEEGSHVEKGQVLYRIDDAKYRAAHERAKAALTRAKAAEEVTRLEVERVRKLIESKAVSQQQLDNAEAAWREARADVEVAQAEVASTAVDLGYTEITSPIDGYVGTSQVTRGALVKAEQDMALTTVQQLDPIYVDLTQSAAELLELRRALSRGSARPASGIPVTIVLEDGSRFAHEGKLTFTDVAVDPTTGSYALRIVVPNPEHVMMPGMYVRALLSKAVLEHGVLVPQEGIGRDPKGNASALVVKADNTVEQRAVAVSRTIGDNWLVDSGLGAGDRVIVAGLQKVRPGMTVEVTEVESVDDGSRPVTETDEDDSPPAGTTD